LEWGYSGAGFTSEEKDLVGLPADLLQNALHSELGYIAIGFYTNRLLYRFAMRVRPDPQFGLYKTNFTIFFAGLWRKP